MEWTAFTDHADVKHYIDAIETLKGTGKRFSDVSDNNGNQYVDLVMEGGGVLGLALVGYTYGLEKAGLRFRSTAGTSAGAINALFLQAVASPEQEKSQRLAEIVASMPMKDFQDGGRDGKYFVESWIKKTPLRFLTWVSVIDDIMRLGLNPGDAFHQWVKAQLTDFNVDTWRQLKQQMHTPINGLTYQNPEIDGHSEEIEAQDWLVELKIVSAELTTTTKVVLPSRDGNLFYPVLDDANPADFVRASMSVPVFFEPFRIKGLPNTPEVKREWQALGHKGSIPEEAVFVDGGMLSNFPINLFHRPKTPNSPVRMPTFGIKLGIDKDNLRDIDGPIALCSAMIDCMRHDADEEFIRKNPEFNYLVKEIDTGNHHWLNFDMSEKDKIDLFAKGVKAAYEFLSKFEWHTYKEIRK